MFKWQGKATTTTNIRNVVGQGNKNAVGSNVPGVSATHPGMGNKGMCRNVGCSKAHNQVTWVKVFRNVKRQAPAGRSVMSGNVVGNQGVMQKVTGRTTTNREER